MTSFETLLFQMYEQLFFIFYFYLFMYFYETGFYHTPRPGSVPEQGVRTGDSAELSSEGNL